MAKTIPQDALIILHNRLMAFMQRHPERRLIVAEAAQFYGVSTTTIYRALHKYNQPKSVYRSDYNNPPQYPQRKNAILLRTYCCFKTPDQQ